MTDSVGMDARLARRIGEKKKKLDEYRPLDSAISRRLNEDFRIETTYHSNAIEGTTLTLAETEMVLEYGMTIDGHPLREHLEVTNHAKAFDAMESLMRNPIDMETVLFLHRVVKAQIDNDAGQLRTIPVHIRGAGFTPPPARDVPLYLAQWVRWLQSDQAFRYEPVTRAAIAHERAGTDLQYHCGLPGAACTHGQVRGPETRSSLVCHGRGCRKVLP